MTQSMYSLTHGAQAAPLAVACGQATHRGRQRHENQDCAACFEIPVENAGLLLDWQRTTVAIVADGMGGAPGGARASALAVAAFQFALLRRTDQPMSDRLESALQFAHRALAETAVHEPHLEGMRTTLVAAAVTGNQLYLIHAGDSRAYLVRNGIAYQLTVDHSWVQDAQDNNELSAADAGRHPRRSEINRCLGGSAPMSGDHAIVAPLRAGLAGYAERSFVESLTLKAGDSVLLCSDGLHGVAALPTMATLVTSLPAQAAADQLVALANANGGPDNIAAVVMAVEPQVLQSPSGEQPVHDGWTLRAIQASLATIVVALLGVSAYAIPNLVEGGRLPGSTPIPQPSAIVTMPATIGAPGAAGPPSEATRLAPQRSVSQAVPASAPLIPPTATLYPTPTSTLTPTITPTFTPTITPTITPPPTLAPTSTPGAASDATYAATKADMTLPTATPPAQQSSPLATPAASID